MAFIVMGSFTLHSYLQVFFSFLWSMTTILFLAQITREKATSESMRCDLWSMEWMQRKMYRLGSKCSGQCHQLSIQNTQSDWRIWSEFFAIKFLILNFHIFRAAAKHLKAKLARIKSIAICTTAILPPRNIDAQNWVKEAPPIIMKSKDEKNRWKRLSSKYLFPSHCHLFSFAY